MFWDEFRASKLRGYEEAKRRGEVDEDIIPLLDLINSSDRFVTLSSCSGRIAVIDMPDFGNKVESKFLGKWHREVSVGEVLEAVKMGTMVTWLIMYPPIIHVACRDLKSAEMIMRIANDSGLRRCGIISVKKLVVEINSLERLELPVAVNGEVLMDERTLKVIVRFANLKLGRSKEKLRRFYSLLSQELSRSREL